MVAKSGEKASDPGISATLHKNLWTIQFLRLQNLKRDPS